MTKLFKCANPKCTTKVSELEEMMQINPDAGALVNYCLKNKGTVVDQGALLKLKVEVGKFRCSPCFEIFLKRRALRDFYHLLNYLPEKESKERDEQRNKDEYRHSEIAGANA